MILKFNVPNQTLLSKYFNKELRVVADSKNYLIAQFDFSGQEWKDKIIYVLFTYKNKTYKKILGAEEGLNKNQCYVAPEVIKANGFSISLCCDNLVTTNSVTIPVIASGYTENIVNQESTPSVMEQMNQLMKKYALVCNQILLDCEKIKEELRGEK